ncbi:MAG: SurA N-terminal domain-containing protein [Candidatus Mariimomonas ferrooxydans]
MMIKNKKIFFVLLLITCYLSLVTVVNAEVLDRVVAVVNDEVILLSEFNEASQIAVGLGLDLTKGEVLEGLVNRLLLLEQAEKFTRENIFVVQTVMDENVLINEYIEKRLRAFIRISFDRIDSFYEENREFFAPQDKSAATYTHDFYDVRDEIEAYLREKELNKRLIGHIEELREKAYIRIQLQRSTDGAG